MLVILLKKIILFIIFISLLSLICAFYISSLPRIKEYGSMEIKRLNQLIVTHNYSSKYSYNDLVTIDRNGNNEIETVHFNMVLLNVISGKMVDELQNTYQSIEEGNYHAKNNSYYEKTIEEVSKKGILSKVPIFSSLSLLFIPVHFKQLSYIGSNIKKEINNYGINHIMIEISIEITMNLVMIYPFFEEYETYTFEVPILLELYQGQIPENYISRGAQ